MYVERINATAIATSGTGNTAETTITVPSSFEPVSGCIYDISITAQVPVATAGTILTITNGTITGSVYQRMTCNYARCRALDSCKIVRVQFFNDPAHYVLLDVRR